MTPDPTQPMKLTAGQKPLPRPLFAIYTDERFTAFSLVCKIFATGRIGNTPAYLALDANGHTIWKPADRFFIVSKERD